MRVRPRWGVAGNVWQPRTFPKEGLCRLDHDCEAAQFVADLLERLALFHLHAEELVGDVQVAYTQRLPGLQAHGFFALVRRQPPQSVALALAEGDPLANVCRLDRMQNVLTLVREVALQAENDGGVRQAFDAPGGRYMVDDKAMGVPHIASMKEVDAEKL